TDTAIWRRIRLIPFEITIPENERDRHLSEKLSKELSGIFNWALEGCLKWQNEGLGFPEEVRTATENYRDEMDVLNDFINDCCILHETAKVKSKDLYDEYFEWCERNGEKPLSKRGFALKLKEKNFMPARIGPQRARGWTGLALLTRGVDGGSRTQLC
ncbi:MAG: DNA primase, partial [Deltaproteobacteria bacterium]|nr:DNA primase [Deltaproteobacteria bacterium]